jgi:hypothetical protein
MDSISNARNYFINQGLGSDQADMLVSKGMEAYNQQNQPQSMMTMASGGIARLGYGLGDFVRGSGVAQPVSGGDTNGGGFGGMGLMSKLIQQNPQMFRSTQVRDFIDENQNGIDDRQEAAYGGRIGYQMGGVSTMPMDYGQSLQVPQQMPTNFSSAQNITMNPLLNYGQPQLGQAGGTPLSMNRGGIARLGYQMGGEADMSQVNSENGQPQMDPQNALTIILQMLIEKGIPLEQAKKLAMKIIELFTQGGAPAVEEFANQLKQQEQSQAMASGGLAGYAKRQGYGWGSFVGDIIGGAADFVGDVVGGIGDAVESVAKSKIGKIALTVAAVYFGGPMLASGLGISSAAGAALAGGLANSALQIASGQGFNPLQALIAAGGAYAGAGGFSDTANAATSITADGVNAASNIADYTAANPVSSLSTAQQLTNPEFLTGTITQPSISLGASSSFPTGIPDITGTLTQPSSYLQAPTSTGLEGQIGTGYATAPPNQPFYMQGAGDGSPINESAMYDRLYPSATEKFTTSVSNFGSDMLNKAQTGIQNLYNDPLGTIKDLAGSAYDYAKENPIKTAVGLSSLATLGAQLGVPRNEGEDDQSYEKRLQEAQGYITQYGRNLQIRNPYFYQREGAVNPFAPTMAANGGIMGYRKGGSMVPPARQIEGGIIELDARKTGGYIPYGKKERVDDVPAMLAKDEFVFTSRAVKAAGGGSAKRGAAKMYALMKQLEGARA